MSEEVTQVETAPMPNWDLAKVLYSQGVAYVDIIAATGVSLQALRKRITRQNWSTLRHGLSKALSSKITITRTRPIDTILTGASNSIRERLARHLDKSSAVLDHLKPPKSYKSLQAQQKAIAPLVDNCAKVLPWAQSSESIVSMSFLESASEVTESASSELNTINIVRNPNELPMNNDNVTGESDSQPDVNDHVKD